MESTIIDLKSRRSIRQFKAEPIDPEKLKKIVEAGTWAPSGMGRQSAKMVVIQNAEVIRRLSRLNASFMPGFDGDPFYGATTVIVVLADRSVSTYVEDGSLVLGNLLNAAHAVGVGSCWIHRAREVFDSEEGKELKKQWGVPEEYIGVGHCVLGYRDCEYPTAKPRKDGFVIRV